MDSQPPPVADGHDAFPSFDEAVAALRQLVHLRQRFGPHDERLEFLLAASLQVLAERFGDDDSVERRSVRSAA